MPSCSSFLASSPCQGVLLRNIRWKEKAALTTITNRGIDPFSSSSSLFPSSSSLSRSSGSLCNDTTNNRSGCGLSISSGSMLLLDRVSPLQQQRPLYQVRQVRRLHSAYVTATTTTTTTTTITPPTRRPFVSSSADIPSTVPVSIEEAKTMTRQALMKIGWDEDDATLQAEIMVAAELCGNNQGLVKMYNPNLMAPAPNAGKPTVERDTPSSAVINGQQAPGMLAAVTAADLVAQKLLGPNKNNTQQQEENESPVNIAIVSAYNTSTSSGQLAFYVERIARKGFIGLALCNSPEFVAAAPGGKPVFGTNPLAVGIPRGPDVAPFTFDMATSAIALFGVLSAKAKGEALPHGVAYGKDGQFTTDAAEALEGGGGAIATFGGHKGAGLALVVELLAGALSGSAVLGQVPSKRAAKSWGHTFVAIRPQALTDDYESKVSSVLAAVQASGDNIRIPGERSTRTAAERLETGILPIPARIWESILQTAEHGLPKPPLRVEDKLFQTIMKQQNQPKDDDDK